MIKVYNTIHWNENVNEYNKRLLLQKPSDFKYFTITSNIEEADVIFITDNINSSNVLKLRNKNSKVILLQREPSYLNMFNNNLVEISDYVFTYKEGSLCFVVWWLDYDYNYLLNLKYNDLVKNKNFICITSSKTNTKGQQLRLNALTHLQHIFNIDFYGFSNLANIFRNYKGQPETFTKTTGINKNKDKSILGEYHKSFSFENGQEKNFVTRVNEDLLMWTLPLYWGCPNLNEIYPKNSYRYIDISKPLSAEDIEIINEPVSKDEVIAIEEARLLVLQKYNWWFYVKEILHL